VLNESLTAVGSGLKYNTGLHQTFGRPTNTGGNGNNQKGNWGLRVHSTISRARGKGEPEKGGGGTSKKKSVKRQRSKVENDRKIYGKKKGGPSQNH